MRIAVFHNLKPGGAKRTLFMQVKYLSRRHELFIFELTSADEKVWDIRKFAKKTFRQPFDLKSRLPGFLARLEKDYKNFVTLNRAHEELAKKIDSGNFDACLIHADHLTQSPFILQHLRTPSLYFCQEYLRMVYEKELEFKEPVIFYKRYYELFTREIRKIIDRSNANQAQVILVNSNFTKKNIKKAYGRDSITCYLGVDTATFKPREVNKKSIALFVGNPSVAKGYKLAESAVRMAKDIRLEALGTAGKLKIKDDIALSKAYSEALITLCTSVNEPFGLSAVESMACETPVLAVSQGGFKETIINGKTGYLLPRKAEAFAEKISMLVNNEKLRKKLGRKGRQHVSNNFTWQKHCKIVEQNLIKIANK
jgi:glycosyltransferase involved in cell wall biosynthesis